MNQDGLLQDLGRCQAPWRRSPDGRCPNQIPEDKKEGTRFCSKKCRSRAHARDKRAHFLSDLARGVFQKLQEARRKARLPALSLDPTLITAARLRAAEKVQEMQGPTERPRIFCGRVTVEALGNAPPALPKEADLRRVGVEVLPHPQGGYLVVTAVL